MNYLAEILAFSNWIRYNSGVSKSDICLWYGLMSIANRFSWKEFNAPILMLLSETKLTKNEFYKSRNKLKQFGLLEFKERGGSRATVYKMNSIVSLYGTQMQTQTQIQTQTQMQTQMQTQTQTQNVNIHKTKNQKPETKNQKQKEIKKKKFGEFKNVLLTEDEFFRLEAECGPMLSSVIEYLSSYIEMKGYKAKSHYLAIKKWVISAVKEQRLKDERLKMLQEGGGNFDWNRGSPPKKLCTDYAE